MPETAYDPNDPEKRIRTVSKFAGEEFDVGNVRTVFAGASKDNIERKEHVILLFGPTGSGKSGLIDCMCNYFYGAKFDGTHYKIANEIFDRGSTPVKSIIKYVFNETAMPFRPVIIDTPEIDGDSGILTEAEIARMLRDFLAQNHHISINAIGLVLKFDEAQIPFSREERIKETINLFPRQMKPNTIILFSSSDEKRAVPPSIKILLRYLNLSYQKYYFFDERSLRCDPHKEKRRDEQQVKSSWDLTMSELDRFFDHVRRLNPQQVDENNAPIASTNPEKQKYSSTTYSLYSSDKNQNSMQSKKSAPHERIIPVKLISQDSRGGAMKYDTTAFIKELNSHETLVNTPVIKRYVYDPGTMTHKEYIIKMQRDGEAPAVEYIDVRSFSAGSGPHKILPLASVHSPHETLINDIPPENMMKQSLSPENNELPYRHIEGSPPPEYGLETVNVLQRTPADSNQGQKTIVEKRTSTAENAESQQTANQYPKSAVRRQIVKRTSSNGAEQSKNRGSYNATSATTRTSWCSSQQQQPYQNVHVKQTEQITMRMEDGILSARNASKENGSQQQPRQEQESYVITPEMKRSRSPIQFRLTLGKKKRYPSSGSGSAHYDTDEAVEQPRALETNVDRNIHSPLRSYGRLVREDELDRRPGDGVILTEEVAARNQADSAVHYEVPPNEINSRLTEGQNADIQSGVGAEKAAGVPSYGGGERDRLLGIRQLNLEEGLSPHPYKPEQGELETIGVRPMAIGKTNYSSWNWINCCFYLLAPLFIVFVIIAIVITLAVLA